MAGLHGFIPKLNSKEGCWTCMLNFGIEEGNGEGREESECRLELLISCFLP
jgi:hypothetical protein